MIGIFLMKKDSAIGRFHIWHIELRAIMEKPWTGYGRNRVLGVYGETQADFFSQKHAMIISQELQVVPSMPSMNILR